MPKVKGIYIEQEDNEFECPIQFLLYSIPQNVKKFYFIHRSSFINITDYLYIFRETFSKITMKIEISCFELNSDEFSTLVKAAKGVKTLSFIYCKINSDSEWDFGDMKEWKLNSLNLNNWGYELCSNWKMNPHLLKNILIGINKWKWMRENLSKIDLSYLNSKVDLKMIKEITRKYPKLKQTIFKYKL